MGAPKGNNYWEFRNKHGRGFTYTPEKLWEEAEAYFEWMKNRVWNKKEMIKSGELAGTLIDVPTSTPLSIETFCIFADIDMKTFYNYRTNEDPYKEFFPIASRIAEIIGSQQLEGAAVGAYNPSIIARKLGLAEKTMLQGDKDNPLAVTPIVGMKIINTSTDPLLE